VRGKFDAVDLIGHPFAVVILSKFLRDLDIASSSLSILSLVVMLFSMSCALVVANVIFSAVYCIVLYSNLLYRIVLDGKCDKFNTNQQYFRVACMFSLSCATLFQ